MFMSNGSINQSRQGTTVKCCAAPAQAQYRPGRGCGKAVPRVRAVIAPSLSLPRGSGRTRRTGCNFRSDGADNTETSINYGSSATRARVQQWPDHGHDCVPCASGLSGFSKKAWVSGGLDAARLRSILIMHLIGCVNRSSHMPMTF